jgi:hypothetical protein
VLNRTEFIHTFKGFCCEKARTKSLHPNMMQQWSEPVVLLAPSASLVFEWLSRIIHVVVVKGLQNID